jgi:hypothetical protein
MGWTLIIGHVEYREQSHQNPISLALNVHSILGMADSRKQKLTKLKSARLAEALLSLAET